MALETEANVEIAKAEQIEKDTDELRQQFRDNWDLYIMDEFQIPTEEGSWENVTSNKARNLADYIINTIISGRLNLWIPMEAEKVRERKSIANTERMVYGTIAQADKRLTSIPEQTAIFPSLAFDATTFGFSCIKFFMTEDEGKVIPVVSMLDPMHTFWISGSSKKGLIWLGNRYYLSEQDAKDQFGNDKITSENGVVKLWVITDREQEGIAFGDKWLDKQDHKLGYIPASIRPVGATRLRQDKDGKSKLLYLGASCFDADRNMFPLHSRLWSYFLTAAGQAAKSPLILQYNSQLSPNFEKEVSDKDFQKGNVIFLDVVKGQDYKEYLKPPSFEHIQYMIQGLESMISEGGVPPIAQGTLNQYMPAAGISILTHSAQAKLKPVVTNMQEQFEWLADEIVRQYVAGDFDKMDVQGFDRFGKAFQLEVSKKDVEAKWHFKCEISPNTPQDDMQNIGVAVQGRKSGIFSRQKAMEITHLVQDPDGEAARIDREDAEQIAEVKLWEMAAALLEDSGGKMTPQFMIVMNKLGEMAQPKQPQLPPGASTQNVPGAMRPANLEANPAMTGAQEIAIPPEVREAVRQQGMRQ